MSSTLITTSGFKYPVCVPSGGNDFGRFKWFFPLFIIFAFSLTSFHVSAEETPLFSATEETLAEPDSTIDPEQPKKSDKQMAERLSKIYENIESLQAVKVNVEDGVVVLTGTLGSLGAVDRARSLAERLEGTVIVDNRLQVDRRLESRLGVTLEKLKERFTTFLSLLPLVLVAIVIIIGFYLLGRWLGSMTSIFRRLSPNPFIAELMGQFVQLAVTVAGVILALQVTGAEGALASVAGGVGIVGLALSFATRDTIENYIASILLSLKQPFSPNDHVIVADKEGLVVRLTSRATILMSFDGNHIRIPNSAVYKSIIVNYSRNPKRRFDFEVGISTEADLTKARNLAVEALENMQGVLDDPPPKCVVSGFGDSTMQLKVLGWVDQRKADFSKVKSEAIRNVKEQFDNADVIMPNPTYDIQYLSDTGVVKELGEKLEASGRTGAAEAPTRHEPSPAEKPAQQTTAEDIKLDSSIEKQIAEEQKKNESNLLDHTAPKE